MTAGLDGGIPVELVNWILSFIEDPEDLLNLTLSSKFIKKCVERFLYSSYRNLTLETHSLVAMVHRLIDEPNLAQLMKNVEIGHWNTKRRVISPNYDYHLEKITNDEFRRLVDAAKQTGLVDATQNSDPDSLRPIVKNEGTYYDYGSGYDTDAYDSETEGQYAVHPDEADGGDYSDVQLLRCLRYGIEDAQVILLLSLLPRLEKLSLKEVPDGVRLSWDKLSSVHKFPVLREIRASGVDGEIPWDLRYLKPLLSLPSMRELKAYLSTSSGEVAFAEMFDFQPKSLFLTHIHLERCTIDTDTIENLLKGCKGLESFAFTVAGNGLEDDEFNGSLPQFTAPQLKKALLAQKGSLKELTVDMSDWCFRHDYGTFGSLMEFEVLERLTMDYGTLRWHPDLGLDEADYNSDEMHRLNTEPPLPELLPKSLKVLNILWAPPVIVVNLLQFGSTPRKEYPNLSSIDITMFELDFTRREAPGYGMMVTQLKDMGIAYMERSQCAKPPVPTLLSWLAEPYILTRWNTGTSKYESTRRKSTFQRYLDQMPRCPHMEANGPDIDCFAQDWEHEGWGPYAESIPDDSDEGDYFFEFEHRPRGLPWIFGDMSDLDDEDEDGEDEDEGEDEDDEEELFGGDSGIESVD
ncbi:uncharacterized protein K452DRAFT_284766 [Aplosporella prunicola CBS 121167]|uniref:Leucine-rich repeat domain-containing protein n=1 Tax=Aplosporella prunicola CBS 121167 TaxID=1176127 RepID=A0A6A6BLA1_9PEZI|nr:uncharacterized protein K452DRAFT_284766 [Aplosporella prunicola CBS 121167]KAF2144448.1 hypothetical protein K452DRAFT_284766 [Aplosporella prunicola CBS 121167]